LEWASYPIRVERQAEVVRGDSKGVRARCSLAAMTEEPAQHPLDVEQLVAELRQRVERERAAGTYADDLSGFAPPTPPQAGDASGPRVRFRPELGFSSKPVIGPVITLVKRLILRLQFYVLDDLARQADAAIADVEARLAAEIATRERLESEMEGKVRELEAQIRHLERGTGPEDKGV
jgi:hypothetical protein